MQRLDDSDPGLAYTPPNAWFIGGDDNEYNFTTHGTRNAGAQIQFVFAGTGIDVYGTTPHNNLSAPPVSNRFTLDGGEPVSWSAVANPIPTYNTNMFGAHKLQDGTHTLLMEVLVRDSETWIDYLEVSRATSSSVPALASVNTPSPETITKTSTETRPLPTTSEVPTVPSKVVTVQESESSVAFDDARSTTIGTLSSITPSTPTAQTSTSSSLAPASTTPSPASDTHSTVSPGTVAGISVGGTLALVLALLVLVFCLRRRRVSSNADPPTVPRSSPRFTGIRPFLLWDNEPSSSSATMGNPTTSDKRNLPFSGRSHRSSGGEKTYRSNESPPSYVP
ncbi:hypothetical protein PM082_023047 [Marasmius tenuissimus]|nr:hypothetical protein PM082_023047 [Marasmius tenuissimus]